MHWCHGAPGQIYLFTRAAKILKNPKYLDEAKAAADSIWKEGVMKRSLSICHGTAGNGYALSSQHN